MAAESMEIDDSLYRQVYHLSYITVYYSLPCWVLETLQVQTYNREGGQN